VTVGDLHGDYENSVKVLQMAGVVDENVTWVGGNNTILVQTGDIVDRGPDTIILYSLMQRLKEESYHAGGDVIQVLGNHEVMNLSGDWRFVTLSDVQTFGSLVNRRLAFSISGFIGRHLFHLPIVHRIDTTVFCHGGVSETWAAFGVHGLNDISRWELPKFSKDGDWQQRLMQYPIFGENGPTWFRDFALQEEAVICPRLTRVLEKLKVKRMVVGHTVQVNGKVLVRCQGKFIVVDVGISRAYGGRMAALEIWPNGRMEAIYRDGREVIHSGIP